MLRVVLLNSMRIKLVSVGLILDMTKSESNHKILSNKCLRGHILKSNHVCANCIWVVSSLLNVTWAAVYYRAGIWSTLLDLWLVYSCIQKYFDQFENYSWLVKQLLLFGGWGGNKLLAMIHASWKCVCFLHSNYLHLYGFFYIWPIH